MIYPFLKMLAGNACKVLLAASLLIPYLGFGQCTTPSDQAFATYEDLTYGPSLTYQCITYTGSSTTGVYVGIGNAVTRSLTWSPIFSGSAVGIGNNGPGGGGYAELRSENENNFAVNSMVADFYGHTNGNCSQLYNVVGYRDGNEVLRINSLDITASRIAGSGTNTISWVRNSYNNEGNNSGTLTFGQGWGNVDMIRFYAVEAAPNNNFLIVMDNIDFSPVSALPVIFGTIGASLSADQLRVNWNTLSETNNDKFAVQLSTDGEKFATVATVQSKAVNGNADGVLSYDLDIDIKGAQWLISAAGLLLLLLSFSKYKKVLDVFTLLTLSCLFYGCSKSSLPAEDLNTAIYVRIAQVDKDGAKSFSKAVKVVADE